MLHCFQLCSNLVFNDLEFWVKPQSTTWFLRFTLQEYDDERWTSVFWMTKVSVFITSLTTYVRTFTNKTHIFPVIVKVVCTLFKPTQGSSMILYSELFAIGKQTVSNVVHNTSRVINITLRHGIVMISNGLHYLLHDFMSIQSYFTSMSYETIDL